MDIEQFLSALLRELSNLEFVEKVDFHTEVFILKGRVFLQKQRFLQVYFNELTGTIAFALIKQGKRVWGVDYDKGRGWHLHPVDHPEAHENINPPTIKEIATFLSKAWGFLD